MIRFENGERFPLLLSEAQPLFQPTAYTISMLRSRGVASNTLVANLRAILHLYVWASTTGVDIEKRLHGGDFLTLSEIEALSRACRNPLEYIKTAYKITSKHRPQPLSIPLERIRKRPPQSKEPQVCLDTAATRLRYIHAFVNWLTLNRLANLPNSERSTYEASRQKMLEAILARVPIARSRAQEGSRQGLSPEILDCLLSAIEVGCINNPWNKLYIQFRNRLFIYVLLQLGIRRGEALSIKIEHIDLRQNTILIVRSPDSPEDPRTHEPNTKTRDRKLPLSNELADMLHHYVTQIRSSIKNARLHSFLFVAHDSGKPLALTSVNKLFRILRERVPGLPEELTPHVMRHTWNDHFSELVDSKNISEADELKTRSYSMGWSETSGTAVKYTRRWTKKRATEISLELQNNLISRYEPK